MSRNDAWILHAGAIGDFVLTLSIVQALRRIAYEPIRILGRPWYSEIAGPADGVDCVDCLDAFPWHQLFGEQPGDAVDAIKARGVPQLVLDMLGISAAAADALKKSGVATIVRLDPRAEPGSTRHITQQWADSLRVQGIEWPIEAPRIRPATPPSTRAGTIIHVGSGGRDKCWPIANWIECAKQFRESGEHVGFLIGPAELERSKAAEWRASMGDLGEIVEAPPFPMLKRMLTRAAAFLGNDSGVTHMAAAMSTPTIAVFGVTDPRIWRPLGSFVTTLGDANAWPRVSDVLSAAETLRASGLHGEIAERA
ncbi:MAG: glycosyltransferase family 9 protein [Phycisphaerales bacterium]|nr:glycosyltransferase family 9 protein [Phycisphaerales bacterium]MCB9857656.1 glycosyltransferase family 9 protein [Phycisphaerales bacterium]